MKQRSRIYYTESQKSLMWDRWQQANLPSESVLAHVVVCTITLCVVAHGFIANAWAKGISRRLGSDSA